MKKTKYADICLPYFKKGDDMSHCLIECNGNISKALEMHSTLMLSASEQLINIKNFIDQHPDIEFSMEADTHMICLTGPTDLIDEMVKLDLVDDSMWEDMDEDEDFFDEENWDANAEEGNCSICSEKKLIQNEIFGEKEIPICFSCLINKIEEEEEV